MWKFERGRNWIVQISGMVLLLIAAPSLWAQGADYKISPELRSALTEDADATAPFFVVFGERADLKPAYRITDRVARARYVEQALRAVADRSQAGVRGFLQGRRVDFIAYWIENKIYVRQGTLDLARELARRPEVVALLPEKVYTIPQPQAEAPTTQSTEWNIKQIRAPEVWATGNRGQGIVVANIDTGVQYTHPALVNQYRGNTGSSFSHTGNWKDPTGVCGNTPCDNNAHGTHTMGTMVGDDGAGNQIGVAPGAKWIACKGCQTSSCFSNHLISCAQWVVSPGGAGPPDVVNNSWGGSGGSSWYQSYVQAWVAAGIFPAFSIGNSGPSCNTAGSPGDYPESIGVGATDINDAIASFSSRGPSAFGSNIIKPDLAAPGVSVRSSVPTSSYSSFSGTSMAGPHVAGAVALLWAGTTLDNDIPNTELALKNSAAILTSSTQTCGGIPVGNSPNNIYGWGRIDAFAALGTGGTVNQPPTVSISAPPNGTSYNCPTGLISFTGAASDPEDDDVALTNSIEWTDNGTNFGSTGGTVTRSFDCIAAGNHTITASITDSGGLTDTDTITITIVDPNALVAPGTLTATVTGSNVNLNWIDTNGSEDGYYVERKNKGSWVRINISSGPNITAYTDVSPGKGTWQYRVQAFKSVNVSPYSNIASVRIR